MGKNPGRLIAAQRSSQAGFDLLLTYLVNQLRSLVEFMDVDYDILWEVATRDLPPLVAALEAIVLSAED